MSLSIIRCARAGGAAASLLALLVSSIPALADDPGPADPGVARLSVLSGEVDVKRADSGSTFAAAINAPVSPGDYLSTLDDSRAEVEFDYGAALRVAPDTQLRFTRLDPQNHQLQLAQGTVEVRVFRGLHSHPEVDTPSATIHPDTSGAYRVTVTDDGNTLVTVRSGQADVATAAATQTIGPGATLLVTGGADAAQFQTVALVPLDDFDSFNSDRDAYVGRAHDAVYVDEGIVGADDLDGYGHWIDAASYGQVWVPYAQPAGWAPYHDGRWVWEPYYGWTWVAAEPWGWAPYHYGNWFYAAGTGWAWYPGAYAVATPYVYRPAMVAFFSFGGGVGGGFSFSFGDVGWVPIAPFEPFHPWWGFGGGGGWGYGHTTIVSNTTIVNNYNTTYVNNGNITKIYQNASAPGGAVAVSGANFSHGTFTHVQPVSVNELQNAQPVHGVVPVVPTGHNLAFNGAQPAPIAGGAIAPGKFAHFAPPPVAPKSFAAQRASVATTAQTSYPEHAPLFAPKAPGQTQPGYAAPKQPGQTQPEYATPKQPVQAQPGYVAPEHGTSAAPGAPSTSTSTSTSKDPWNRFNNAPAGSTVKPSSGEPAERNYVQPSVHTPAPSVPKAYAPPRAYTPKSNAPTYRAPKVKTHTPKPEKAS